MSFLYSLENSLKSLESRDERDPVGEAEQRENKRSYAIATAPWAESLKNSQYVKDLLNLSVAEGHRIRAKIYMAWVESTLRLEARGRALELKPTPSGIVAEFISSDGEQVRQTVDLGGNPSALLQSWLAGENAPTPVRAGASEEVEGTP